MYDRCKIAAYAKRLLRMQKDCCACKRIAAYAKRLLRMQKDCCACKRLLRMQKDCCACKRLLRMQKAAAYAKGLLRMQKAAAYAKGLLRMQKNCCACKRIAAHAKGLLRMQKAAAYAKGCCVCKRIAAQKLHNHFMLGAWVVASIDVSIRIDYYACNRREVEDGENMDDIIFSRAEQSSINRNINESRIIDNYCQQHDEASVSAKDAVPCGQTMFEEFDQDHVYRMP
eukprot:gene15214-6417_t